MEQEKTGNGTFKVSETMEISDQANIKPAYLNIKIGDKWFSTTFSNMQGMDFNRCMVSIANTKNIGKQNSLFITGFFTETNGHVKLPNKIPFNFCFYSEIPKEDKHNGDLNKWLN